MCDKRRVTHSATDLALDVRAADYPRFLAIQLAPAAARPALYGLTAFAAELGRIAESVSEPLLGHIRLAWWREALEEIAAGGPPRQHPLVAALAAVHAAYPDSWPLLLRMIEARAADLDSGSLAEEAQWLGYLDGTAGALHRAWAVILDAAQAARHEEAIAREARAFAMVGLVRAIPYFHAQGFMRFPEARLDAAGLQDLRPGAPLPALVLPMLAEAEAQLRTPQEWPRSLRPLRALSCAARYYVRAMRQVNGDPYELPKPSLGLVLKIIQMKFLLC